MRAENDLVVPRQSHIFLKTCKVGCLFFKVNGINELEQLTGWVVGAGKDLVGPRPSHTF